MAEVQETYKVSGMTCASCASSIESYLKPIDGVDAVSANYANQSVDLKYDPEKVSIEQLQGKAKEIGYEIIVDSSGDTFEKKETNRLKILKIRLVFSAIFSIPIFVIAMFFMGKVPYENWIMMGLSVPVLTWTGSEFFTIAWRKLKRFSANMDTLVALSTGVAFLFSVFNTVYPEYFLKRNMMPHVYYESAVVIITLILLGRYLEERAKSKTSFAIKKLMGLQPKKVTVIRNGEEQTIDVDDIIVGELIILRPGDKVPVDGKVKKGESYIDESMITGEPIPVAKKKSDKVFSGTINQKGTLRILANKVGKDTLLSQIIHLVEQAQASKPTIQKLADKIAGVFVPIVILLAALTFSIWLLWGPEPQLTFAILTTITVLIIACPCALGLATPTALMVGIGKAAQNGILIKDAQALETAHRIDALILDKTGTITAGKPEVTDLIWIDGVDESECQKSLFAIESASEHPIAEAICKYFKTKGIQPTILDSFDSITGMGAEAKIENKQWRVGNLKLMRRHNVNLPEKLLAQSEKLKSEAKTVIFVSKETAAMGILAVADQIKDESITAIRQIKNMGIEVHMLTGDNEKTAEVIAHQAGIDKVMANVMPSDKGDFVKKLQEEGKIVAMAGDGINDSHALAQADVGFAMGSGTDIAMESASITLMHSNLQQIALGIKISKATMVMIKQNLFWAFFYNIIAIPVAAGVLYPISDFLLNPMIAGGAMSLSSISVLTNSLRLKQKKIQ